MLSALTGRSCARSVIPILTAASACPIFAVASAKYSECQCIYHQLMHFQNAIMVFLSRVVQEELEEQQLWYELDKQTNCKPTTLGKKLRNQHAQSTYKSTEKHIYLPDAPVFFGFMAYIRNMNKQQGILLWRQQGAAFQVYRTFFLSVHSYSSYVLFHVIEILVETHTGVNIRP